MTSGKGNTTVETFLGSIRKTIDDYRLLEAGDRVMCACSGGADSTALLIALVKLRDEMKLELSVVHFNHGLRKAAAGDEAFVRELAGTFRLPFQAGRADVRATAAQRRTNLEEAARDLRYGFLEDAARHFTGARIAVGHTLDDQAETVLMRLMRGSGPRGLTGIWPSRGGTIIRPLIRLRRSDVLDFLAIEGQKFRTDESNRDRRYFRNKVRLDLLPFIREQVAGDIVPRLGRLAEILHDEEIWLSSLVGRAEEEAVVLEDSAPVLRLDVLDRFPKAMKRRLVRRYLRRISGHVRGLTFEDVDRILNLKSGRRFILRDGLHIRREGGCLRSCPAHPDQSYYTRDWDGSSPLVVAEAGLMFGGRVLERAPEGRLKGDDRTRIYLDKAGLRFPLTVRSRRDGDAYRPLGAPGRKKVKEILRARGIPLGQRDRVPVFLSGGEIVWIYGLPVAEAFRVKETTAEVFVIECRSLE